MTEKERDKEADTRAVGLRLARCGVTPPSGEVGLCDLVKQAERNEAVAVLLEEMSAAAHAICSAPVRLTLAEWESLSAAERAALVQAASAIEEERAGA